MKLQGKYKGVMAFIIGAGSMFVFSGCECRNREEWKRECLFQIAKWDRIAERYTKAAEQIESLASKEEKKDIKEILSNDAHDLFIKEDDAYARSNHYRNELRKLDGDRR